MRLLNQNDARPTDLSVFAELGHVHAHLLQFSGAIWYPMVYELPQAAKTAFGKQKRDRQFDRTLRYIDDLKASLRLPDRRPAVLPRRRAVAVQRHLRRRGQHLPRPVGLPDRVRARSAATTAWCCCPARVAEVDRRRAARVTHPVDDVEEFFANKERAPARSTRERQRPVIEAAKASWRHPEIDVLGGDEAADRAAAGGVDLPGQGRRRPGPLRPGRLRRRERSSRSWWTSRASRSGRTPTRRCATASGPSGRWSSTCCFIDEVDWVNSLFLSCRFSAARIGQYNEFVYAFFKCLSEERLQYAEGWYAEHERSTDAEDITLGDWVVQRRCPHLKADLTRFGIVDGDMLTCQLHGWKFDLRQRPLPDQRRPQGPRPPGRRGNPGPRRRSGDLTRPPRRVDRHRPSRSRGYCRPTASRGDNFMINAGEVRVSGRASAARSARMRRAALWPAAPMTLPAGWQPALPAYTPSMPVA